MRTIKLYAFGLAAVMIFICSQQTSAQIVDFYSSPGYTSLIDNLITNHIWNSSMERYTKDYTNKNPGGSGVPQSKPSAPAKPYEVPAYRRYPAVQFKPTGTRLMLQELADTFGKTPQDKADWKVLISETLDKYEAAARAKGYPHDLALAYVSYVGLNKLVYHGVTEEPIIPFEQNIGLRDVVAELATDHGTFSKYTDREKQTLYELFVVYGAVTYHLYEKALREKKTEEIKNAKLLAAQNLEHAGVKP
jgi:hypothetical protein